MRQQAGEDPEHMARMVRRPAHAEPRVRGSTVDDLKAMPERRHHPTAGDDANAIQDLNGNDAASFSNVAATNSSEIAPTAPGAPTNLSASAVSQPQIDLSWSAPGDNGDRAVTGYRIEVSTDGGTSYSDLVADTSSTATSHSDT